MASTTFVDSSTIIVASWLNDVNAGIYTTLPLKAPLVSPSFTTPVLGVASVTTLNKLTFTQPATGSTLTIADGKTLTASNTITLAGTDGSTLNIGVGGTVSGTNTGDQLIATSAQVKTGSDNTRIVSALALNSALGFSAYFQSTDQTITSGGTLTIAHGLGRTPILIQPFLKCVTNLSNNYSTGDITPVLQDPANSHGVVITADSTNIAIRYGSGASAFAILDKSTGTGSTAINGNWSFFVRVWA